MLITLLKRSVVIFLFLAVLSACSNAVEEASKTSRGTDDDTGTSTNPLNTWVWISGSDTTNSKGIYGQQKVTEANNVPGARTSSVSWIDSNNQLWLFGGLGYDANRQGKLNDLWQFLY